MDRFHRQAEFQPHLLIYEPLCDFENILHPAWPSFSSFIKGRWRLLPLLRLRLSAPIQLRLLKGSVIQTALWAPSAPGLHLTRFPKAASLLSQDYQSPHDRAGLCEPNPEQAQPNQTVATGVLPPPSAHSQGRDHFRLAILQGSSTRGDEGEGNKIVCQASLKNKQRA